MNREKREGKKKNLQSTAKVLFSYVTLDKGVMMDEDGRSDGKERVKSRWRKQEEGGGPNAKHVASITG